MPVTYPVNRQASDPLPEGSAKQALRSMENCYFALEQASQEAQEEGLGQQIGPMIGEAQAAILEWNQANVSHIQAQLELTRQKVDAMLGKISNVRKAAYGAKRQGYEKEPGIVVRGGGPIGYTHSHLDGLLWDARLQAIAAASITSPGSAPLGGWSDKASGEDPDFYQGKLRSEITTPAGGPAFGAGGSPFTG